MIEIKSTLFIKKVDRKGQENHYFNVISYILEGKMEEYGYVRVSSKDQFEDRQVIALKECGVKSGNIYIDKISGKNFDRKMYKRLLRKLKETDVIFIKSIDRLGRNYEEVIEQWRILTKEKHADIVVLDMPLLDTRDKGKDLTGKFISDLVLQILSYVAETERSQIKQRQAEGIKAAKARGVRFGRPQKKVSEGFDEILEKWIVNEVSARQAAIKLNISHHTFLKWVGMKKQISKIV